MVRADLLGGRGLPGDQRVGFASQFSDGCLAEELADDPRLKEWAYAGLVFDTGGALFSHLSSHNPVSKWAPALLGLLLVGSSYVLFRRTTLADVSVGSR